MLRHFVVLAVAVAVAVGSAQQIMRMSGEHAAPALTPASPDVAAADNVSTGTVAEEDQASSVDAQVVKATDGHYWAEAQVNGRWIHCLIDTGATEVALTRQDAERLGIDTGALDYDVPVNTAHGLGKAARVDLAYVAVAGARVEHVPAIVAADGLSTSLLGMTYLGRLSRFEATPTSLILRP